MVRLPKTKEGALWRLNGAGTSLAGGIRHIAATFELDPTKAGTNDSHRDATGMARGMHRASRHQKAASQARSAQYAFAAERVARLCSRCSGTI